MTGRMELGHGFEQECADELRRLGCAVDRFGQGLVSHVVRSWMTDTRSPLRWLPDLVVWKPSTPLQLVDAKTKYRTDTPNTSIEMRSLWTSWWIELPVWYACKTPTGIQVITAEQIRDDGFDGSCCSECRDVLQATVDLGGRLSTLPVYCPRAKLRGNASKTPFVLVAYRRMKPLADVFTVSRTLKVGG